MSKGPTPIRPDIVPRFDGEREMLDFLASKLREYCDEAGQAPAAVAVVFLSDLGEHDQRRHVTSSRAAGLLLKRATES